MIGKLLLGASVAGSYETQASERLLDIEHRHHRRLGYSISFGGWSMKK